MEHTLEHTLELPLGTTPASCSGVLEGVEAVPSLEPKTTVSSTSNKVRATRGAASWTERMKHEMAIASRSDDNDIFTSACMQKTKKKQ